MTYLMMKYSYPFSRVSKPISGVAHKLWAIGICHAVVIVVLLFMFLPYKMYSPQNAQGHKVSLKANRA